MGFSVDLLDLYVSDFDFDLAMATQILYTVVRVLFNP